VGDGDDHILALDQVFVFKAIPGGGDFGDTRRGIGGADFLKLAAHHAVKLHAVGKDREVFLDRERQFFELVADLVTAQRSEAVEAQFEDRLHLPFGQLVSAAAFICARLDRFDQTNILRDIANRPFLGEQLGACFGRVAGRADHRHDFIEVRHRDHQTQQQVRPFARLVEFELGAPGDDFLAEGDEALHDVAQGQRFGAAAADR